jgi:hypothetical protein
MQCFIAEYLIRRINNLKSNTYIRSNKFEVPFNTLFALVKGLRENLVGTEEKNYLSVRK